MRKTVGSQHQLIKSPIEKDLDWIVMKCLEKDRARRYATANGLAADLYRYLCNEPVVARPPSGVYLLWKAWCRNRILFTAGTAVVVSLVLGLVLALWKSVEASHARDAAEAARRQLEHHLYLAKAKLVGSAWDENNLGRVRELLRETAGHPSCGLEWYLWQRRTHLELRTLRGTCAGSCCCLFSRQPKDCDRQSGPYRQGFGGCSRHGDPVL